MSYNVIAVPVFKKELKKLVRKYPSLKSEFINLIESLCQNPTQGTSLGANCFKIRLSIASKGKGKSGGARIITCFLIQDETVYLLSIYDKSEKDSVSDKELAILLKHIES